jgi:hypothetical protein
MNRLLSAGLLKDFVHDEKYFFLDTFASASLSRGRS